ncbi:hypothetical protein BC834DRAFT_656107 [Gloeopeniophorella convolvens]|nr:hypothetical protein BC834DRAFT_656107 [Gloeopeniophorella convolvens]
MTFIGAVMRASAPGSSTILVRHPGTRSARGEVTPRTPKEKCEHGGRTPICTSSSCTRHSVLIATTDSELLRDPLMQSRLRPQSACLAHCVREKERAQAPPEDSKTDNANRDTRRRTYGKQHARSGACATSMCRGAWPRHRHLLGLRCAQGKGTARCQCSRLAVSTR